MLKDFDRLLMSDGVQRLSEKRSDILALSILYAQYSNFNN